MSVDKFREALHSVGIPIDEEWVIQEMAMKRDIREIPGETDVYGNVNAKVEVVGQQITLVVYRAEN